MVNLTSILYLGALAINSISGINTTLCMYVLAIFAIFITLGGMKVIGYTDVIQVFFLILGGLVTTYLALSLVSDKFGGTGVVGVRVIVAVRVAVGVRVIVGVKVLVGVPVSVRVGVGVSVTIDGGVGVASP